jgi:hypothetical protein
LSPVNQFNSSQKIPETPCTSPTKSTKLNGGNHPGRTVDIVLKKDTAVSLDVFLGSASVLFDKEIGIAIEPAADELPNSIRAPYALIGRASKAVLTNVSNAKLSNRRSKLASFGGGDWRRPIVSRPALLPVPFRDQ